MTLPRPVDPKRKWVKQHAEWAKTFKVGASVKEYQKHDKSQSLPLEVNLKKSRKFFQRSQPQAASMVSLAREMSALDLLSYYHDNNLACLNISQSLHCMPILTAHSDPLPCLTWETKSWFSKMTSRMTYLYLGLPESSWCSRRTRRSPDSSSDGNWWCWWAYLSTAWLALKILRRKCFGLYKMLFENHPDMHA